MANPTELARIGRTNVCVTCLSLGTSALAGLYYPVEESTAHATVERALEIGLNYFDTAPVYGHGNAETRLGHVLSKHPRESFIIGDKIGRPLQPLAPGERKEEHYWFGTPQDLMPVFDFSYDGVMRSLEESLKRLQLDRIDILYIHDPDTEEHFEQALAEAYPAVDKLRSESVIDAVGVGVDRVDILARFAREADIDCFLLPGRYTLLYHDSLDELMPLCARRNISIIVGGVYNSGILINPEPGATFDYQTAAQHWIDKARRIKDVCDRYDVPLMAAAIQFPLAHPAVASVLNGARSVGELEQNVQMFQHPIPANLWGELRAEGLIRADAPTPT